MSTASTSDHRSTIGDGPWDTPPLPIRQIASVIAEPKTHRKRWLVDSLWGESAVGVIGGSPKNCKTWFGLDIAVSVASGTPALGRFPVERRGDVLLYLAEETLDALQDRVAGITHHRGLDLAKLPLHVITAPALRLDSETDRARLAHALEQHTPRLLLLDPLIRLHRLNENQSGDISGLLGFLREMQRQHQTAIIIVHHFAKRVGANLGQALRGSGDLHAWGDSNAYLTRSRGKIRLAVEHRAAPSIAPLDLQLRTDDGPVRLELVDADTSRIEEIPIHKRIELALANTDGPLTRQQLRKHLRIRNERLGQVIAELELQGRLRRIDGGWTLADHSTTPV